MIKPLVNQLFGAAGLEVIRKGTRTPFPHHRSRLLEQLSGTMLCDIFSRILRARTGKTRLNCATVGHDGRFFAYSEALRDIGLDLGANFETGTEDAFHVGQPLSSLQCSSFDALLVIPSEPAREGELVARLESIQKQQQTRTLVFRLGILSDALQRVLSSLRSQDFNSCLNAVKLYTVGFAVYATRSRECIIEAGSYLGGTGIFMGLLLEALNDARHVHCVDTYEGMPVPTEKDGATFYQAGLFTEAMLDRVQGHVNAHQLAHRVTLHKGLVQEVVLVILGEGNRVSFALVDTDQYAGTAASLGAILPRLERGGAIIVDDFTVAGVQEAIREARERHPSFVGVEVTHNFYLMWDKDGDFLR